MHVGETIALMFVLILRIRAYSILRRRRQFITVTMSRHRYRYMMYSTAKSWEAPELTRIVYTLFGHVRHALHCSTSSADSIPILAEVLCIFKESKP
jgi:hypothetical protein